MKNTLYFNILMFFLLSSAYGQMTISEWKEILIQNDSSWRVGYENFIQEGIKAKAIDEEWLPSITANPSYSLKKEKTGSVDELSQTVSLGMTLSQKLCVGTMFSSSFNQTVTSEMPGLGTYGYNTSGSVSLLVPLFYSQYSDTRELTKYSETSGNCARYAGDSRWQASQLRMIANTLSLFLKTSVLIDRQKNREALMEWYKQTLKNEQFLFESGQISSIDFASARNESISVETAYRESQYSLVNSLRQTDAWEIDPASIEIEGWLFTIEGEIGSEKRKTAVEYELETSRYDLGCAISELVDDELDCLPKLSVSYSYTPGFAVSNKKDTWTALYDYWNSPLSMDWSISASISVPLMPWSPVWDINKLGTSKRSAFRARFADISRTSDGIAESIQKVLNQRSLMVTQANRSWLLEKDRLDLYRIRATNGDLSEMDVRYQEIQARNAQLDWYSARIDFIVACLCGD
ncbi:MAG: TolC family protein [Treponema sp.]|nr:MAG: TolC family protein [Treponema sp.]